MKLCSYIRINRILVTIPQWTWRRYPQVAECSALSFQTYLEIRSHCLGPSFEFYRASRAHLAGSRMRAISCSAARHTPLRNDNDSVPAASAPAPWLSLVSLDTRHCFIFLNLSTRFTPPSTLNKRWQLSSFPPINPKIV